MLKINHWCKKCINRDANFCPHCSCPYEEAFYTKLRWFNTGVGILAIIVALYALFFK